MVPHGLEMSRSTFGSVNPGSQNGWSTPGLGFNGSASAVADLTAKALNWCAASTMASASQFTLLRCVAFHGAEGLEISLDQLFVTFGSQETWYGSISGTIPIPSPDHYRVSHQRDGGTSWLWTNAYKSTTGICTLISAGFFWSVWARFVWCILFFFSALRVANCTPNDGDLYKYFLSHVARRMPHNKCSCIECLCTICVR